jgi:hypothetical protein
MSAPPHQDGPPGVPRQYSPSAVPRQVRAPAYPVERFTSFLERTSLAVLDVIPGASADSRRLLVGSASTGVVSHAVAAGYGTTPAAAVDNEQRILTGLRVLLRPGLRRTVPRVVQRVELAAPTPGPATGQVTGLVMAVARGRQPLGGTPQPNRTGSVLAAVDLWLGALWQDTAGTPAQVDLGAAATASVQTRYSGSTRLAPVLGPLRRARRNLAQFEVPRTLSHGCLCPRHIGFADRSVVGVDDWGLAEAAADPLRDLGRFAVEVAGRRLPEVVAGRTSYAVAMRGFVAAGLERNAVPRRLWRDVLVLSQVERAVQALDRGDLDGLAVLVATVHALPAKY